MLKVDIIICKGIVINLYDITVALIFFSIVNGRRSRAGSRRCPPHRTPLPVPPSAPDPLPPPHTPRRATEPPHECACMYVHYGDVCYVKCINIAKIIYDTYI